MKTWLEPGSNFICDPALQLRVKVEGDSSSIVDGSDTGTDWIEEVTVHDGAILDLEKNWIMTYNNNTINILT